MPINALYAKVKATEKENAMTIQSKITQIARFDHSGHFEQIAGDERYDGELLIAEYRLLYHDYCGLKRRIDLLKKENNDLQTQLVEMSRSLELAGRIDPMTGLANRRDIIEKIEREFSRAVRHQRTFSLMLADLDDFNKVNAEHGYNTGDDVLVEVARVLRSCIRSEDVCARWGGEQFLFLLTETNIDGALAVAEKINNSISMTVFKVRKPGISITVSLGLCEFQPGRSLEECFTLADQALRRAKKEGKDRFVVVR